MSHLIRGETITEAWLNAVIYLRSVGWEQFDLVVDVDDATPSATPPGVIGTLDQFLMRKGLQSVRTVANTIFPAQLARSSATPERLSERYLSILPRLHRQSKNRKGTYFERLISYPLRQAGEGPVNQLAILIHDLRTEVGHRSRGQGAKRHMFEAQIFAPGKDRRPMGFPCMSSLSFHIDRDRLRLTATYRNQYYIERALGNVLGLAELQQFIADAVGLSQGPLTIHAFHAELDPGIGLGEVDALIRRCQAAAPSKAVRARSA